MIVEEDAEALPCDLHLAIADRRPRRKAPKPKRFGDDIPEPPSSLPPAPVVDQATLHQSPIRTHVTRLKRILKSPRNVFGLFRQYFATNFPLHDPDAELAIQDLSDSLEEGDGITESYGPYPNHSSFSLGEWFWNSGHQKSKSDFKHLLGIITDPAFRADDVRNTRWDQIDQQLGDSEADTDWIDEPDAGWMKTPITIQVPFPYKGVRRDQYRPEPIAPQEFTITDFYHRSIVSVLKERLESKDAAHFHMEPYELYWQPNGKTIPTRVQGEIYTSPAFIEAHNTLQNSAGEPGCDLPRVVVALMFASDATHLTSFGQAKIWPLYMNFGNDSKYRRSKPSLHLCNHVAYFQRVSPIIEFIISL